MLNKKRFKLEKRCKSFLSRLYDILNDSNNKDIIHWNKEGNGILISDINKLCDIVLPKYYKHNNYSSFVRQLNMYGFHKSKGIIKDGEGFEHEKFNKKSNKEQIKQMNRKNKKIKLLSKYIKNSYNNSLEISNKNNNDDIFNNENDILKFLLEKNEENIKYINELKKEVDELKNQNNGLLNQLQLYKNGHTILLEKIIKYKNKNRKKNIPTPKKNKKSENLKELFRKYLYYLKIYSPYIIIKNKNNNIYKPEKVESFKIENVAIKKEMPTSINNINNINNINVNMDSFFDEPSFINANKDMKSFDFNLHGNCSNSFFNNNKDFK